MASRWFTPETEHASKASLVFEHIVPNGKGLAFRLWHVRLANSARRCDGCMRVDLCAPVKGAHLSWYSIIHFDSPDHLNQWLKSKEREALIEEGRKIFELYQFKSFSTGLEGWFSRSSKAEQFGLGPPAWKQNLAIVVGLYPMVMVQTFLFTTLHLMHSWSHASSMLVNNLISSSILTWLVMPLVTKGLSFWLTPDRHSSLKLNVLGTGVVAIVLLGMLSLFNYLEL
jgi:uncharacterized protein